MPREKQPPEKRYAHVRIVHFSCLLLLLILLACGERDTVDEPAQDEVGPRQTTDAHEEGPSSECTWHIAYHGARSGDHGGTYVSHGADGRGASRLTRQIAFQEEDVLGLTISFGEEPLPPGWTGTRRMGTSDFDGRISLALGEEFPWQNSMTGERRPFTVTITRNDERAIAGSFQASLLNVPRRPEVDLGDIEAEGEFVWRAGKCRR